MISIHRFLRWFFPIILLVQSISAKSPQFEASPTPHAIPGVFEAEDFSATTGTVDTERTSRYEAGEGEAIRPSNSSSVTYPVTVAEDGMYELKIRYARANGGAAVCHLSSSIGPLAIDDRRILLDKIATLDYYDTLTLTVELTAGAQDLTFLCSSFLGNTTFNRFAFRRLPDSTPVEHVYFVSPSATEVGDGSLANPLTSLQSAFDQVRELNLNDPDHGPVEIRLLEGTHAVSQPITMDADYSATAKGHVTVMPHGDDKVIISAGRRIPTDQLTLVADQPSLDRLKAVAQGNVYRVTLDDNDWLGRFPGGFNEGMVSYDGKALQLARYPNKGLVEATNVAGSGDRFRVNPVMDNPAQWDAEWLDSGETLVTGHMIFDEFESYAMASNITNNGEVFLDNFTGLTNIRRKLRVINLLCELDMPGEWYYDRARREFYIWPVGDLALEPEIRVGGSYAIMEANDVDFWTFKNLIFQDVGGSGTNGGVQNMLLFTACEDNLFAGNTLRNSNARFASRFNTGTRTRVTANDYYDCFGAFVFGPGTRIFPFTHGQGEFTNNHIHSCRSRGYELGAFGGVGSVMANNLIHNVQGGVIYAGNDNLMEKNEWYDLGFELGDSNVAYYGASYANWGVVVRHNFVHHFMQAPSRKRIGAFRGDDGAAGLNVIGNIFYKAGEYAVAVSRPDSVINNNVVVNTYEHLLAREGNGLIGRPVETAQDVMDEYDAQLNQVPSPITPNKFTYLYNAEQILGDTFWEDLYFKYKYTFADDAFQVNPFNSRHIQFRKNYISGVTRPIDGNVGPIDDASRIQAGYDFVTDSEAPVTVSPTDFEDLDILDLRFKDGFTYQSGTYALPFEDIGLIQDPQYRTRVTVPDKATYRAETKLRWDGRASNAAGVPFNPATDNDVYRGLAVDRIIDFDMGTTTSPLPLNATRITEDTRGDVGWVGDVAQISSRDLGFGATSNRDQCYGSGNWAFEAEVENGTWYAEVFFFDDVVRSGFNVRAENQTPTPANTNITQPAATDFRKYVSARVIDGRFTIEFSGAERSVARIRIRRIPFGGFPTLSTKVLGMFDDAEDIGSPARNGNVFANSTGQYLIESTGTDLGNGTDQFYYAYNTVSTNSSQMQARVDQFENSVSDSKVGVIYRDHSTMPDTNNKYVSVTVQPNGQAFLHWRESDGGATQSIPGSLSAVLPKWVRIEKEGNVFQAYESANGSDWTFIDEVTLAISGDLRAGILGTSADNSQESRFTLSNVQVREGLFDYRRDVGSPLPGGSYKENADGSITLQAGGDQIFFRDDRFFYAASQDIEENMLIETRVDSVDSSYIWSKSGIMFREDDSNDSRHVLLMVRTDGQVAMQWRTSPDVNATNSGPLQGGASFAKYLRLTKTGEVFKGYYSSDGIQWTLFDEIVLPGLNSGFVGLALSSQQRHVLATSTYSETSIRSGTFVDQNATVYNYRFGPRNTTMPSGTCLIAPEAYGDISWDGFVDSRDRNANLSIVFNSQTRTLEHALSAGVWEVQAGVEDVFAHDQVSISAEGNLLNPALISIATGQRVTASAQVAVTDGSLSLELSDLGGVDSNWVISDLTLTRIASATDDTDGDDLTDVFELQYFGDRMSAATGSQDTDGDGQNNASEMIAGTNPIDNSSTFRFDIVEPTSGDPASVDLNWKSVSGRLYSVFYTDDLTNGPWVFLKEVESQGAQTITEVPAGTGTYRFYRIGIE